jgi:hypothetical protein
MSSNQTSASWNEESSKNKTIEFFLCLIQFFEHCCADHRKKGEEAGVHHKVMTCKTCKKENATIKEPLNSAALTLR